MNREGKPVKNFSREYGKMLVRKIGETNHHARQTQGKPLAARDARATTIVDRGISAPRCGRHSWANRGSFRGEACALGASPRQRRAPGERMERSRDVGPGAGRGGRRKNRLLGRFRVCRSGRARSRMANHKIPHRQHLERRVERPDSGLISKAPLRRLDANAIPVVPGQLLIWNS